MKQRNKPDIGVCFLFATLLGICICAAMLAWGCFLPGCSAAQSQSGRDALTESVNGLLAKVSAFDNKLDATAGRDVNSGLSSRGITFIVLGAIACYAFIRWDINRSNKKTTERAIRKAANGDGPHSDGFRSTR